MKKTQASAFGFIILMLIADVWAAPVSDTGMTKCYNVAGNVISCPSPGQALYGQDANYSINPMSYTKLDGSGNTLPDSTTSWVMVRDNVTGLIWEMKTNDGTIHDKDNTYTWYDPSDPNPGIQGNGTDTKDFIDALNSAHFGGYSDWRLPTIQELANIVNYSIPNPGPTIDAGYFPNTEKSFYWSSTTNASNTNYAWGVNFQSGTASNIGKNGGSYVRAIRGGQAGSLGNLVNGTITDTSTGLMWQQAGSSDPMNWEQALAYCEELNLGGYTDWRLPTIKELLSIADYSRYNPAINTTYFPGTVSFLNWSTTNSSLYWSSTTDAATTYFAWGVSFYYGFNYSGNKSYENGYVRAVRGEQAGSLCTATLNGNLLLHIPYLSYDNGTLSLWADLLYEFNPIYPTLIPFKLNNANFISKPSFSCAASTLSSDLKIHIPDVLLPDASTHLWVDLEYSSALSIMGNAFFIVKYYGVVSN
jgi:hypothetical protein